MRRTDIINRLIKKGLIHQRNDSNDKRSRMLTLSTPGKDAILQSFKKASVARDILLSGVTEEDKKLVSQILFPIQEKHAKLSVENKGKTIEEIYANIFGKKDTT